MLIYSKFCTVTFSRNFHVYIVNQTLHLSYQVEHVLFDVGSQLRRELIYVPVLWEIKVPSCLWRSFDKWRNGKGRFLSQTKIRGEETDALKKVQVCVEDNFAAVSWKNWKLKSNWQKFAAFCLAEEFKFCNRARFFCTFSLQIPNLPLSHRTSNSFSSNVYRVVGANVPRVPWRQFSPRTLLLLSNTHKHGRGMERAAESFRLCLGCL